MTLEEKRERLKHLEKVQREVTTRFFSFNSKLEKEINELTADIKLSSRRKIYVPLEIAPPALAFAEIE